MGVVIRAEQVGKRYTLRHQESGYQPLRETLGHACKTFAHRLLRPASWGKATRGQQSEEFWALRHVSFEVRKGERLGIIGPNGAGKSTLLKILSRITELSQGRVAIKGRVASLLEVGTGFHPELTGRENIYLSGAILGMGKREIQQKFDEIVEFAEIDRFLDTPVKRYSSGMYVRLAFAVAAHLEPEILVIDEVLAVGDARFQHKCLGKMESVGQEGRTILFVSHNMQTIRRLCHRVLLLDNGRLLLDSDPDQAIRRYLESGVTGTGQQDLRTTIANLPADPAFRLLDIELRQQGEPVGDLVANGLPLHLAIHYEIKKRVHSFRVYFDLCDEQGTILLRSFHDENQAAKTTMQPGFYVSQVAIPANILGPIRYVLKVRATVFNVRCCVPPEGICIPLRVTATGPLNRAYPEDTFRAKLMLPLEWQTNVVARPSA